MHLGRRPEAAHLASTQATRLPRHAYWLLTSSLGPFDGPFCEAGLAGWLAGWLFLHFPGGRRPHFPEQLIVNSSFGALLRFLLACLRTLFHSCIPVSADQVYVCVRVRLCEFSRPFRCASRLLFPRA